MPALTGRAFRRLFAASTWLGLAAGPALAGSITVLHAFTGGADGSQPYKGVTIDSKGNLYGESFYGADPCPDSYQYANVGCGTVYSLPAGGAFTVLQTFHGAANGADGFSNLTLAGKTLYGGTYLGGGNDQGLLFSLGTTGKKFTILHSFNGTDGQNPSSFVRVGGNGVMYSITPSGGPGYTGSDPSGAGTLFALMPDGTYVSEHPFSGGADGGGPGRIFLDSADTIYGGAGYGGACSGSGVPANGCGTVYSFVPSTGAFTVLHTFDGSTEGYSPQLAGLDAKGNLYGSTFEGGVNGYGTLFELVRGKKSYTFKLLWSFTGGADGAYPGASPALAGDGTLTGVTLDGPVATSNMGVLYSFKAGTLTPLFTFTGDANGSYPQGTPVLDGAGNIYGTTNFGGTKPCDTKAGTLISSLGCGVLYKFAP